MKCPSCSAILSSIAVGDFTLDACSGGCGGVWFDKDELLKFDEKHEFPTSAILRLAKSRESNKVDATKIKYCPRCTAEVLVRQFIDPQREIEIDQCWSCSGVWLDVGEINALRAQFETTEDRSKAVNLYVDTKLDEIQQQMKRDTERDIARYNEATSNRFKAAVYAFKQLIGLDPFPGDSL